MARYRFGGTEAEWIMSAQDAAAQYGAGALVARLEPDTVVGFYTLKTAGTQHTDLLTVPAGAAVTTITTEGVGAGLSPGALPEFDGPEGGPVGMWADANGGSGPRRLILANDAAARAILDHVLGGDPHGSFAYADAYHEIVVRYNSVTASWPTAASVPANPAIEWLWKGPSGIAPPVGAGYMREGDEHREIPVA